MIRYPASFVGQAVELHYRPSLRVTGLHLRTGRIVCAGRGPGPINALVALDGGGSVVVPRGHLNLIGEGGLQKRRGQRELLLAEPENGKESR